MPTMISSAVMTCSFSLPRRFSVSSPFEVFAQGCWSPSQRDLLPIRLRTQVRRGAWQVEVAFTAALQGLPWQS
jgi:hypothetical protein